MNSRKNVGRDLISSNFQRPVFSREFPKTSFSREQNKHLYDKLLVNEVNRGKGFSVKKGMLNSTGTHIIFQDADLEYDPNDYKKFEKIFSDFDADGIIGSRFIYSNYTRSHNILNKIANTLLTFLFNLFNATKYFSAIRLS